MRVKGEGRREKGELADLRQEREFSLMPYPFSLDGVIFSATC
jgi:hypothetical protein